ncbi:MAG: hypothetical protein O7F73_21280 [Gammaproteobacteria bacterium]|nr:hypothetical protein [Gammaproteobacteria bacterium]
MLQTRSAATGRRQEMAFAGEMASAERFEANGEPEKAETIYRSILRREPQR